MNGVTHRALLYYQCKEMESIFEEIELILLVGIEFRAVAPIVYRHVSHLMSSICLEHRPVSN